MTVPVLIVGAGLAGTATAAALAARGVRSVLLGDPTEAAASDIPLAVMAPYPSPPTDALTRLRARGAVCTQAWMGRLEQAGVDGGRRASGVLLLPASERDRRRRERAPRHGGGPVRLCAATLRDRHGIDAREPGIFHPLGACIDPAALRRALLAAGGTHIRHEARSIAALQRTSRGWAALGADGRAAFEGRSLVLAAGAGSTTLWPALEGLLTPVRGQATAFACHAGSVTLALPVSSGGYVTPAVSGRHWVGATAQRGDTDRRPRAADDRANARRMAALWPGLDPGKPLDRFVAIRAATPDRLPLVGSLADGLWINAGHGAHGLLSAPLSAIRLARWIARGSGTRTRVAPPRPG